MNSARPTRRRKPSSYPTPYVTPGTRVECLARGLVKIVGTSAAEIPWPIGELRGEEALIVYKGLWRALHVESPVNIAAWWGVPIEQVRQWQALLPPQVAPPVDEQPDDGKQPLPARRPVPRRRPAPKPVEPRDPSRPFTEQEDAVVRVVGPEVAADKLQRSVAQIHERRQILGLGQHRARTYRRSK